MFEKEGNTLYACHPGLMMVIGCPEVPPWPYLLARFPAKKNVKKIKAWCYNSNMIT